MRQGKGVRCCGRDERGSTQTEPNERGGRGEQCGRLYPSVKQAKGKLCGLLHRRVAGCSYHIHSTTALTMTSDRTTSPALPFHFNSSSCSSRARLHGEPGERFGSGAAIDMRCRRRPRLGMGWLRSMLSPLRKLWCRVNAVQQRKSTLPCPSHALLCSVLFVLLLRFSGF